MSSCPPAAGTATVDGVTVTAVGPDGLARGDPARHGPEFDPRGATELARGVAFDSWLVNGEATAAANLSCSHDKLPDAAPVDMTDYLPFLSLG